MPKKIHFIHNFVCIHSTLKPSPKKKIPCDTVKIKIVQHPQKINFPNDAGIHYIFVHPYFTSIHKKFLNLEIKENISQAYGNKIRNRLEFFTTCVDALTYVHKQTNIP